jgi:hypothetical protein
VLGAGQGLHNPIPEDDEWLSEHVIDVFNDMFRAYERDRDLIPDGRLVEITYETLVADPKAVLGEVYRTLGLGDFARAEASVDAYLEDRRDYRRNDYDLSEADRARVAERWRPYFERFGYDGGGGP